MESADGSEHTHGESPVGHEICLPLTIGHPPPHNLQVTVYGISLRSSQKPGAGPEAQVYCGSLPASPGVPSSLGSR